MKNTNQSLNDKLKSILTDDTNFFDMMENLIAFKKEYESSEFFKRTKMSFEDVVKYAKLYFLINPAILMDKLADLIAGLDVERLTGVLEGTGDLLEKNNKDTLAQIKEFKDLGGAEIAAKEKVINNNKNNIN